MEMTTFCAKKPQIEVKRLGEFWSRGGFGGENQTWYEIYRYKPNKFLAGYRHFKSTPSCSKLAYFYFLGEKSLDRKSQKRHFLLGG